MIKHSPPKYLYRFRSINNLLGEHQELENQEIYFAPLDQLNDPMEGFKDIFWQGDEIVWKNLLIHYLLCLEQILSLQIIAGDSKAIDPKDIPIFKTKQNFPTPEYANIFKEISDLFFQNNSVDNYVKGLALLAQPVSRSELIFYLRMLHPIAIGSISSIFYNHQLVNKDNSVIKDYKPPEFKKPSFTQGNQGINEQIYSILEQANYQLNLITKFNDPSISSNKNKQFILFDFPEKYVKQLEHIVHPEWYTACFMAKSNNSSVWGNYGDKHSGVCLKFKPTNSENGIFISLFGINGWGGNKEKSGPAYGHTNRQFLKVKYTKKYPEIDFFRSLGRHSAPDLMSNWYTDENGARSTCSDHLFKNTEKWRKNYWLKFSNAMNTKLKDWNYENEYRLTLSGSLIDYSEISTRKLKYKFENLEGIIFGINTSEENKLKILKIIDEKCKKENRTDFKFFQAYYSKNSGLIESHELSLLKHSGSN